MTTTTANQRPVARAEHVGSLLRPQRLLDVHRETFTRHASKHTVGDEVRELEDQCIRDAVAKQLAAGLDVVTDGEFRRSTFMSSFDDSIAGFAVDADRPFLFRNETETVPVYGRTYVEHRVEKIGDLGAREAAFLARVAPDARRKATFIAASMAAGPGSFKAGVTRDYADPVELTRHVLGLLRELIDETIAAGADYVQLDFPGYPLWVDETHRKVFADQGVDLETALRDMLMADRQIGEDLPEHVHKALHLCRGNGPGGMWMASGSLEPVAAQVFSLPYDSFLVEWDDPKRQGDFSALEHVPKGPVVVLGLISTKTHVLESEDEILRRIDEASQYLDLDQLALSPQCGFASGASGNPLSEDDQWRKLDLVARVADRAWPR